MTTGPALLVALALLAATAPTWIATVSGIAVLAAILIGLACPHGPVGR